MRGRYDISSIQTLIIPKGQLAFDWESALNYLDANDQVFVFNSTIMNIVTNFVPNKTMNCDNRDSILLQKALAMLKIIFNKKFWSLKQ